jgi:hypothetical protein
VRAGAALAIDLAQQFIDLGEEVVEGGVLGTLGPRGRGQAIR